MKNAGRLEEGELKKGCVRAKRSDMLFLRFCGVEVFQDCAGVFFGALNCGSVSL